VLPVVVEVVSSVKVVVVVVVVSSLKVECLDSATDEVHMVMKIT
jgi:hypothetical protein